MAGRRRLLGAVCYFSLNTGPAIASVGTGPTSGFQDETLVVIRNIFRDLTAAQALGRLYLRGHPEESRLSDLLPLALGPAFAEVARGPDLRRHIARRRARDFIAGDIALLDGWVFSRSEARIVALTVLR